MNEYKMKNTSKCNPIVQEVMHVLESSSSGLLKKQEIEAALYQAAI